MADTPKPSRPARSEAAGRLLPDADRQALHMRLLAVRAHAAKGAKP